MSDTWTISVGGRVYGPYTLEQMRGFQAEGRLADHSLVARSGGNQFQPAREDGELAPLFLAPYTHRDESKPRHGGAVHAGAHEDGARPAHRFGRNEPEAHDGPSHFVIIADMKSRAISGLEEEIFNLGPALCVMHQAWVLTSDATLNTVRSRLVQKLGKMDTLFIVDAARDKAAWFNFGPENDARVRRMWSRPRHHAGFERRAVRRV